MTRRTFLAGASVVLPDRIASGLTIVIEGGRIADLVSGPREIGAGEVRVDLSGRVIVPGFIDVHVHGVAGTDVLDGPGAVAARGQSAAAVGRHRVLSDVDGLRAGGAGDVPAGVASARAAAAPGHARVLPAHLESNFINPEYRGAQPAAVPARARRGRRWRPSDSFTAAEILALIERHRADIGIVTLAPELDGGLDLVRTLVARRYARVAGPFRRVVRRGAGGDRRRRHATRRTCSIACVR